MISLRTDQPAFNYSGVGLTFDGNSIRDAPHQAFSTSGSNDCRFSNNTVEDIGFETDDSGAWYAGRSWVHRGNVLVGNTFRNIRQLEVINTVGQSSMTSAAVYFDDELSGNSVVGNTFINCMMGVLLGGGRENVVTGNRFIDTDTAVHLDSRGESWQKDWCSPCKACPACPREHSCLFAIELAAVNYTVPPWSTHYPTLPSIMENNSLPCAPVNTTVTDNHACGRHGGQPFPTAANPLAGQTDGHGVPASWNLTLRDNTVGSSC